MNLPTFLTSGSATTAATTLVLTSILLTGCAAVPSAPTGSMEVRNKLNTLQNDAQTVQYARVELREADEAVTLAEQPLDADETELAEHRVYMANTMIEIAKSKASVRMAEADRTEMGQRLDAARLAARTAEADRAAADAAKARSSEAAVLAATARETEELRQQILALEAKPTDRGLVLTLGDVLFATGSADIQGGSNQNLEKLANFLTRYPDRDVTIEGHTDNTGTASFNQTLSQQRADSVRRYLIERNIASNRMTTSGLGLDHPVASNDTATGRQQNRRVEVIIADTQ
ncbi:OmpA family protein [Saccharospirillum impatiens]|uniref:OmpA family protein n=1 Tax=Saccharospirillum impatiens TaxID=169438 RepID=UPI0003F818BF|nr:OmpA family protein [Saccharospirillum impatiens]